MSDSSPAGWYEDPYGAPGLLRWWDGLRWTEATEPAQAALPPEPLYGRIPEPLYGQQPPPGRQPPPAPPPAPPYGRPGTVGTGDTGGRGALPWLLAGAAGLVVIVVVVVVSVTLLRGHDDDGGPAAAGGPTPARSSTPVAAAGARSPVTGTITDSRAGISYARLGSPWTPAGAEWFSPNLFDAGEVSPVQVPFERYASFNATNLSGVPRPSESAGYTGPRDLSVVAQRVTGRILTEHFALTRTRHTISSGARTVDGHQAWLEKFRLDFPGAASKGWKFSADTVAILVVDTGGGRLGELWVSVPDTFSGQGDVDQVLDSVKVA